jgi:uncharacterized membrane protein YfcA
MLLFGYMAIIVIGVVLGSMGAGGSMLAIPVLVYAFDLDIELASAYSLFIVGVTSFTGAVLKGKEQLVSFRAAMLFGVPSAFSAFLCRTWIIDFIPEPALMILFAVLMIISSLRMLVKKNPAVPSARVHVLVTLGLVVGAITSLAGVGGGFLIVPMLTIFGGLSFRIAAGTSLFIIASNCLVAFCGDVLNRHIDWNFILPLAALAIAGLIGGYWWHDKTQSRWSWQHAFAWFTMLIGVTMLMTVAA